MLAAAVTTVQNGKASVPAIHAHGGRHMVDGKELGVWVPIDNDMKVLEMNGELRTERLRAWLGGLGDDQTPLEDESEVHVGTQEENAKNLVIRLLRSYRNLLDAQNECPAATTVDVEHHIDTGDTAPIMMKRRRQAQTEDATVDENVDSMLGAGVVEESNGAWGFPVVLVKKRDGTVRFCVDYRALNSVTKRDVYPLPRIDETLEALGGARLFTTLDLRSGYWQIKVAKEDRDKTAFITKRGLYRFTRMPFGLTNAPATSQRLMNGVLRELTWSTCLVYLDDIVIFTKGGIERHIVELACVLERLAAAGLSLRKCVFAAESMEYLGHTLSSKGVQPVDRLIRAHGCRRS
ncbi:Gag-pol Polyprotein [Phytophthora megakarya]|uniref:Gag-pol Polyprotein n=1 Tax=Phytophthora megakarya TaxID=4795 RepID=A0A225UFZ9_9STRA|nr:Gag-pol Polyprotein [Phytophthora megakarya]